MSPPDRPFIPFRQERSASEVLNATFAFLRDEFRGLGMALLVIVGPLVIVSAVLTASYQQATWGAMFDLEALMETQMEPLGLGAVLGALLGYTAFFLAVAVCYAYAMLYEEDGPGPFEPREVWDRLRADFGTYLTTSLWLLVLSVGLGLLSFVCLGIFAFLYLAPMMMLVFPARLDRPQEFWAALNRCRKLVKGVWWPSFGLIVATFVVVIIVSLAVSATMLAGYGMVTQLVGEGLLAQGLQVVLGALGIVSYLGYAVPTVAFVIHYFNLVEQKEGVGLEARIEAMALETGAERKGDVEPSY